MMHSYYLVDLKQQDLETGGSSNGSTEFLCMLVRYGTNLIRVQKKKSSISFELYYQLSKKYLDKNEMRTPGLPALLYKDTPPLLNLHLGRCFNVSLVPESTFACLALKENI